MNVIELIEKYHEVIATERAKIPEKILKVKEVRKPEALAEIYYVLQDFDVYRSRVVDGYRSIGTAIYWTKFANKITPREARLLNCLRDREDFEELVWAVKDKNGTPDLMLLKNEAISFIEVKANNETVKTSTVEFFIRYGHKWPISILRIVEE